MTDSIAKFNTKLPMKSPVKAKSNVESKAPHLQIAKQGSDQ